ncbi:uncharacterized protein C1orf159 homolog isoform X2 [Clupea harengus]|uniref:Uncharacterized protein C1orf159 homolog isoform X2 n=1 Tax=Clupea harengus TaxID=7950 RepID=A0A6P8FF07_CLUHA|nr:uncharacterized protein C1orf159 homolog isoform X2 [Clupea harengus]
MMLLLYNRSQYLPETLSKSLVLVYTKDIVCCSNFRASCSFQTECLILTCNLLFVDKVVMTHCNIFTGAALLMISENFVTKALLQNPITCCGSMQRSNESCMNATHCDSGCHLHVLENNTSMCLSCDSAVPEQGALTVCNHSGPGVAASLLLGTLLISLFLILSVASFFYLKRSNQLPGLFYRRNKAFIFQPSETAVMMPSAGASVRKPRYVRRERPSAASASSSATVSTGPVTRIHNV